MSPPFDKNSGSKPPPISNVLLNSSTPVKSGNAVEPNSGKRSLSLTPKDNLNKGDSNKKVSTETTQDKNLPPVNAGENNCMHVEDVSTLIKPIVSNSQVSASSTVVFDNGTQTPLLFPNDHSGPIYVIIENTDKTKNLGNLHTFALCKKIMNMTKEVSELRRAGRNRIRAQFKSVLSTNLFLSNSSALDQDHINAFIPQHLLFRFRIVKNVPVEMNKEELSEAVKAVVKVQSIRRLKKKIDGKLSPILVI